MALFDTAIQEWQEGTRRLEATPDRERAALELVADATVAELRRRLGSAYTVDELVALYGHGTSWVLDLAYRVAPEAPWAWDERKNLLRPEWQDACPGDWCRYPKDREATPEATYEAA